MSKIMIKQIIVVLVFLGGYAFAKAQEKPSIDPVYENAIAKAQEYAKKGNFNLAEAAYKKAKAVNPKATDAAYNLGNLYYDHTKKYNASNNYIAAAEAATTKEEKHRIYHNQGNLLLENKEYKKAVEVYKKALRNDPTDEETRYNLALAKKEEEKQGGGGGGGDDENDKKDDSESDDQDNKEGDKDKNSDGKNDGKENEKEGDDKKGDGEGDKDKDGKPNDGKDGDGEPKKQDQKAPQRVEGKMTPQQISQILEAMNNEEQKIRDKVNAKKAQGPAKKSEKDW
ncbi:tetratricopeptide repeat protein [uncultured Nonlabens sp.]|uniref:tetratricopeptide repeat protein n=1 Tax=uncultured Nonlabens sp. TaxID=859306 RepID=UPI00261FCE09|nr:tetratricopeptide repeat protein [uncultured Nonlabens sp.]